METTILASPGYSRKFLWRRILVSCGVLSSLLYAFINIYVPTQFNGYSYASHTISELSAIGAPTRSLWMSLAIVYIILFMAFGFGVWQSAGDNKRIRILGGLIIVYCVVNFYWPPMHPRGTEPTLTDTLHIVWSMVTVALMMVMMGFGAAAFGKGFRDYTIVTIVLQVVFGILTGLDAPKIPADLPTPWLGVNERILIGVFLLWIVVLAVVVMRSNNTEPVSMRDTNSR